jgi:hypothetical protein
MWAFIEAKSQLLSNRDSFRGVLQATDGYRRACCIYISVTTGTRKSTEDFSLIVKEEVSKVRNLEGLRSIALGLYAARLLGLSSPMNRPDLEPVLVAVKEQAELRGWTHDSYLESILPKKGRSTKH